MIVASSNSIYNPFYNISSLIFVSVLLLGVIGTQQVRAQEEVELGEAFEIKEVFSMGADEDAPVEYLFSNPEYIPTDDKGRIYVAKEHGSTVRVYDDSGKYLATLGRDGQGPGEFVQVGGIALDAQGRLVVYDRMLQRFTRYAPVGAIETFPVPDTDYVETYSSSDQRRFTPFLMYALADGGVVMFQRPLGQQSLSRPRLHVYGRRLDKRQSFGAPNEWPLPDEEVTRHLMRAWSPFDGHSVAPESSSLLLAPKFYRGRIYRYTPQDDTSWSLNTLVGRHPGHPTHTVLAHESYPVGDDGPDLDLELGTYGSISSSDDQMNTLSQYRVRSGSRGVGVFSDGRVVHLSVSEDEDGVRQLQLELFSSEGRLLRAGRIERFLHDRTDRKIVTRVTSVHLEWVDRRDRMYLVDRRNRFPIIRVVTIGE